MSKFLKIILYVFFMTISISSAFVVMIDEGNQKILSAYAVPNSTQAYLPRNFVTASNYKDVLQIVEGVSKETDTPFVFRSVYLYPNTDGHGRINTFQPNTKSLTFFGSSYSNTSKMPTANGFDIQKKPLSQISYEQLAYGDPFMLGKHSSEAATLLAERLNASYHLSLTSESLRTRPSWYWAMAYNTLKIGAGEFVPLVKLSLYFYALFLLAYLVEKNQKIMIYRLNGLSSFTIANLLLIKEFGLVTLVSTLFSSLFVLRGISSTYLLFVLAAFLGTSLASYAVIWLVGRFSLANQLNNRTFLSGGHYLLSAAKIYVFSLVVIVTIPLSLMFNSATNFLSEPSVAGYGELNTYIPFGYRLTDLTAPSTPNRNLWDYAEKSGAVSAVLDLNSSPTVGRIYKFFQTQDPAGVVIDPVNRLTTLSVNDNYLKKYAILDENGKRIEVRQDTAEGILLVSQKYKSLETDLIKKFSQIGSFNGLTGYNFNTNQVHIIWMKDNQIQTVLDGSGTRVNAEVIPVETLKNAGDIYKFNLTYKNGTTLGLLFPIKGSSAATYDAIKPALVADGEQDLYPLFFTPNELKIWSITGTSINPLMPFIHAAFTFVLFVGIMMAAISFYFKRLKLKIAIQRLNGVSYLRSYWPLLVILGVQYLLVGAWILNSVFPLGPFDIYPPTWETILFYLLIESLITGTILYRLEKITVLDTLKGE